MPSNNASTDLSLPAVTTVAQLLPALNDRMRQIEGLVRATAKSAASSGTVGGGAGNGSGQVVLSIPGTLGMGSNQAPLLTFASSVTPSGLVGLLKETSIGAAVSAQVMVAGVSYATVTIAAGQTQVTIPGAGAIAANALVTLNLVSVGTTFPGSGLSVIIQGV